MTSPVLLGVVGSTCTGKTELALRLAERIDAEIVSVDSAQIFRGMNIGTAKPTRAELARAPHHLIDVAAPDEQWTAAQFGEAARAIVSSIWARGRHAIVCGGTGLWLRALTHGVFEAPPIPAEVRAAVREELEMLGSEQMHARLAAVDPDAAARIHPRDPQRIGRALEVFRAVGTPISVLQRAHGFRHREYRLRAVAIDWPRALLCERINERAAAMYAGGFLDEVRGLLQAGVRRDGPGLSVIGYRDAVRCVDGALSEKAAETETATATRRYAKRQRNWFRKEEDVRWISPDYDLDEVVECLLGGNSERYKPPGANL